LTFGLAVTQLPRQRCGHGLKIAAESVGEAVELGHAALLGGGEPWDERCMVTPSDKLAELQGKSLEEVNRGPVGPELL
jgi:hypothetical protein